eukprot:5389659-Prymnesium_polylepis.1
MAYAHGLGYAARLGLGVCRKPERKGCIFVRTLGNVRPRQVDSGQTTPVTRHHQHPTSSGALRRA